MCRYYADRGHTVEPERMLLTASTSEAYAYLFKLLADPGDEVLVPRPSYPLFEFLAAMESVRVTSVSAGVSRRLGDRLRCAGGRRHGPHARHRPGESEQSHGIVPEAGRTAVSLALCQRAAWR